METVKMIFLLFSLAQVLCAGQDAESQSPVPYSSYKVKSKPHKASVQSYNQYNIKKTYITNECQIQQQCLSDHGVWLGSQCYSSNDDLCSLYVKNSQCLNGYCACQKGYVEVGDIGCVQAVNLKEKCTLTAQCYTPDSHCDQKTDSCVCKDGYISASDKHNFYCLPEKKPTESCEINEECAAANSSCVNGKCQCLDNFVLFQSHCLLAQHLGDHCEVNVECVDELNKCHNQVCSCESSAVLVSNHLGQEKCISEKKLGEKCQFNEQCKQAGSVCLKRQCNCQEGTINLANQLCLPANLKIGEPCFISAQCSIPMNVRSKVVCSMEPQSRNSLCLLEGELFRKGYNYNYNYGQQPYHQFYNQKPYTQYSQNMNVKEEDNYDDDNDDEEEDNQSENYSQKQQKFTYGKSNMKPSQKTVKPMGEESKSNIYQKADKTKLVSYRDTDKKELQKVKSLNYQTQTTKRTNGYQNPLKVQSDTPEEDDYYEYESTVSQTNKPTTNQSGKQTIGKPQTTNQEKNKISSFLKNQKYISKQPAEDEDEDESNENSESSSGYGVSFKPWIKSN